MCVHIYTVQDVSNRIKTTSSTSTHPLNNQTCAEKLFLQIKREAFLKMMCFQMFLERGERRRVADVCKKRVPDFSCLKVERSVSSRFKVNFGDLLHWLRLQYFLVQSPWRFGPIYGEKKKEEKNRKTTTCFLLNVLVRRFGLAVRR